jgi:hypothetical protein
MTHPEMEDIEAALAARSAVIVQGVIDGAAAAALRDRLRHVRYALVDRGSYESADATAERELLATLRELAAATTGRTLLLATARAIRLGPGDYVLAHHDPIVERGVTVVLDASAAPLATGELHVRQGGRVLFRMPVVPGSAAIVPRTPSVTCTHGYVTRRAPGSIVRVVATFSG